MIILHKSESLLDTSIWSAPGHHWTLKKVIWMRKEQIWCLHQRRICSEIPTLKKKSINERFWITSPTFLKTTFTKLKKKSSCTSKHASFHILLAQILYWGKTHTHTDPLLAFSWRKCWHHVTSHSMDTFTRESGTSLPRNCTHRQVIWYIL